MTENDLPLGAPVPGPQHPVTDGCFYCASDAELAAALTGRVRRTLHMQAPLEACPFTDPTDFGVGRAGGRRDG